MVEEKETGRRGREGGGDRKRWEEVRALLKGNAVTVQQVVLQLRVYPIRSPRAGQYRCLNTNNKGSAAVTIQAQQITTHGFYSIGISKL